ncbi:MAG: hypothetical protein P1V36_04515 [Planctomycetota bacterium]|nr:hypothetical protein [Planctomycetota bacterium]
MSEANDDASGPDWGINFERVHCPSCGESMPPIRLPKGWHELMWGGWTCPACGCRMDKWGKARDADAAE